MARTPLEQTRDMLDATLGAKSLAFPKIVSLLNRIDRDLAIQTGKGLLLPDYTISADDAAAAVPIELAVEGMSEQDLTPTPSVPVAIDSVESVAIHASADGTTDATGWPASIDLQGHELRSLPDGTHDELTVDAGGSVTLVQRVGEVTFDGNTSIDTARAPSSPATATRFVIYLPSDAAEVATSKRSNFVSDSFTYSANAVGTAAQQVDGEASLYQYAQKPAMLGCIEGTLDRDGVSAWFAAHNAKVTYPLKTPVTTQLGTITLPELPSPNMTAWADSSPVTKVGMVYRRDLS